MSQNNVAKQSYINKSVRLDDRSTAKLPTWSTPYIQTGNITIAAQVDGVIPFTDIWDALVTNVRGEFYELFLTLSNETRKIIWVHNRWVLGRE